MSFRGRHRVFALFWPWEHDPFICQADMIRATVSKSVGTGSSARISLFPRNVQIGVDSQGREVRSDVGYRDALGPNDWLFVFVHPGDGGNPEPLFLGFLDRVSGTKNVDNAGAVMRTVEVSATGWEKAIQNTIACAHPFIAHSINLATLTALGPAGQPPTREGTERTPGVSVFQDLTHNVIEWLVYAFLNADTALSAEDAFADIMEGIEGEIDEIETTEGNRFGGSVRPLMGQYELPGLNIPLWQFLKLRFQDLDQRCYVDPNMFLNQINTSLAQLIDTVSNQVLNELIYDVRRISSPGLGDLQNHLVREITGGYSQDAVSRFVNAAESVSSSLGALVEDIAPHMILRRRPLTRSDLMDLDGVRLDEGEFTQLDLGRSDADLHNLTLLCTPELSGTSPARMESGFPGLSEWESETLNSIRRHGLRLLEENLTAWPANAAAPIPHPNMIRDWDLRLHRAGLDNSETWSGSAAIPKFVRDLYIGGSLTITPHRSSGTTQDVSRIYQVDSIDYNYDCSGRFLTSLGLVRGYSTSG